MESSERWPSGTKIWTRTPDGGWILRMLVNFTMQGDRAVPVYGPVPPDTPEPVYTYWVSQLLPHLIIEMPDEAHYLN